MEWDRSGIGLEFDWSILVGPAMWAYDFFSVWAFVFIKLNSFLILIPLCLSECVYK